MFSLDREEYEENQKEENCPVRLENSCKTGIFPIQRESARGNALNNRIGCGTTHGMRLKTVNLTEPTENAEKAYRDLFERV